MGNELIAFCLIVALAMCGVVLLAVLSKLVEVRRASAWPSTSGRVVKSRLRSRRRYDIEGRSSFATEPLVTYEYEVAGRLYRSSRISFSERTSSTDLEAILGCYPPETVVQVYYNPDDPRQAVLERDLSTVVAKGVGLLLVVILGAAIIIPLLLIISAGWLAPRLPDPQRALPVVLLAAIGLGSFALAFVMQRQAAASQRWQPAPGRILSSQAEEYQAGVSSEGSSPRRGLFRPTIVYTFQVGEQKVISDRVSFGWDIGWSSPGFFRRSLERYPEDSPVTVYYDPRSPADCVLERRAAGLPVLWGIGVGVLLLAVLLAGWL